MKIASFIFFCLLMIYQSAAAAENTSADAVLKRNIEAVFAVLKKKDLAQETKNSEILEIVTPMFDFSLMAKLTLGRKNWSGLTAAQKEKFTGLFVDRLRAAYLSNLTLYSDEEIIYAPPVENKQKISIPTYLVSKDKKISILYKFYESDSRWKIYDLEIQGVSIIRSYRAQFDQILQNGSFNDLLAKLEKPGQE